MYYMHDGAPAHYSVEIRTFLDEHYNGRWIGRRGPISWPPRSPDLNPLDFYLWGYLKGAVYSSVISSREELWNRIDCACNNIRNSSVNFNRVRQSLVRRLELCVE